MKKLTKFITSSSVQHIDDMKEDFDEDLKLKFTVRKIAFKIVYELKRKNLLQNDLASLLGVTPQNISKLLKGDDYKLSTLVRLEEALSINLIDRDIYSNVNNISVILHVKSFDTIKKPIIVQNNLHCITEQFQLSGNVIEAKAYYNVFNFEERESESIKEYF